MVCWALIRQPMVNILRLFTSKLRWMFMVSLTTGAKSCVFVCLDFYYWSIYNRNGAWRSFPLIWRLCRNMAGCDVDVSAVKIWIYKAFWWQTQGGKISGLTFDSHFAKTNKDKKKTFPLRLPSCITLENPIIIFIKAFKINLTMYLSIFFNLG